MPGDLPLALCEALDIPGVTTVASISVAQIDQQQDMAFIGSSNGYVYCVFSRGGGIVYRRLSILNDGSSSSTATPLAMGRIQVVDVVMIPSTSATEVSGPSTWELLIFVASVSPGNNKYSCLRVLRATSLRNVTNHPSGEAIVEELKCFELPQFFSPLRIFSHTAFLSEGTDHRRIAATAILSCGVIDPTTGVMSSALAYVVVPTSAEQSPNTRPPAASLIWCGATPASSSSSAVEEHGGISAFAWSIGKHAKALALPPITMLRVLCTAPSTPLNPSFASSTAETSLNNSARRSGSSVLSQPPLSPSSRHVVLVGCSDGVFCVWKCDQLLAKLGPTTSTTPLAPPARSATSSSASFFSTSEFEWTAVAWYRGSGPIVDAAHVPYRVPCPFPAVAMPKCIESHIATSESLLSPAYRQSSASHISDATQPQQWVVLDCSGKVVLLNIHGITYDPPLGEAVQVDAQLLPDYVTSLEAHLPTISSSAASSPGVTITVEEPSMLNSSSSELSSKPQADRKARHATKQEDASSSRLHGHKRNIGPLPFPSLRIWGLQDTISSMSSFFRTKRPKASSPVHASMTVSASSGTMHVDSPMSSAERAMEVPHMLAAPPSASGGPLSSSVPTPPFGVSPEGNLIVAQSNVVNEQCGALLGMGVLSVDVVDVDGDGVPEIVITTLGRFVAIYRYDPAHDQYACAEAIQAPTHLYCCKMLRLFGSDATPVWFVCGPSHVLTQSVSTTKDRILARAHLLEKMFHASLET